MHRREQEFRELSTAEVVELSNLLDGAILDGEDPQARAIIAKQFASSGRMKWPSQVLYCANRDDLATALAWLYQRRLSYRVRSGGHCFADRSTSSPIVVDLSRLNRIERVADLVHFGPGVLAADAATALAADARMIPTGGCPWVALGGLSLVGGFGFSGRRLGLFVDQVSEFVIMDCQGQQQIVAPGSTLDWVLRGAGTFGRSVVCELRVRHAPLLSVVAVEASWPLERSWDVFDRWQRWAPFADPAYSIEAGIHGPDDPDESCSFRMFGAVSGIALGEVRRELEVAFGSAYVQDFNTLPVHGLAAAEVLCGLRAWDGSLAWQPSRPYLQTGAQYTRSSFIDQLLTPSQYAELQSLCGDARVYAQAREFEFVPWGAAYTSPATFGAFPQRHAKLLIRGTLMLGAGASDAMHADADRWARAVAKALTRSGERSPYLGYAEPDLTLESYFSSAAAARLVQAQVLT